MRFTRTYGAALVSPVRTFTAIADRGDALAMGARAVAITAAAYTLVYFFLAHNGGRPTEFTPWLRIPDDEYYRWDLFLCAPSIAPGWVAAGGFSHLAARALGGRGGYEATLGLMGVALSVSSWWTGLHDLVTTFLGFVGVLDQRAYEDAMNDASSGPGILIWTLMIGYLAWFLFTFPAAVRAAHALSWPRAFAAGTLGVVVYQLVFVLFNR